MTPPLVSVVMAVYNGEQFLQEAIDSILGQSFTEFEFIIVDDGSEDQSNSILQKIRDTRVVLVKNPSNMGQSTALNKAIKLSKGKYIARCDADDISLENRLFEQFTFMDSNSHIGITGTGYTEIDEKGNEGKTFIYPQNKVEIKWKTLFGPVFPHPTVMIRSELIERFSPFYNESYQTTQDYELWSRLLEYTKGTNLPKPLVKYRRHGKAVSTKKIEMQDENRLRISAKGIAKLLPGRSISIRTAKLCNELRIGNLSLIKDTIKPLDFVHFKELIQAFIKENSSVSSEWKESQLYPLLTTLEKEMMDNNWKQTTIPKAVFTLQVYLITLMFRIWVKQILASPGLLVKYIQWLIRYSI